MAISRTSSLEEAPWRARVRANVKLNRIFDFTYKGLGEFLQTLLFRSAANPNSDSFELFLAFLRPNPTPPSEQNRSHWEVALFTPSISFVFAGPNYFLHSTGTWFLCLIKVLIARCGCGKDHFWKHIWPPEVHWSSLKHPDAIGDAIFLSTLCFVLDDCAK
jgi:hypothetical protein